MQAPTFKIVSVDMDGFCGREHHPERSDVGLVVTLVTAASFYLDADGGMHEVTPKLLRDGIHGVITGAELARDVREWVPRSPAGDEREDDLVRLYTCITDDGRVLDLLDFELEETRR